MTPTRSNDEHDEREQFNADIGEARRAQEEDDLRYEEAVAIYLNED